MQRRILIVKVAVALDPIPGGFHEPEAATNDIQRILNNAIGHYNPVVAFVEVVEPK